MKQGTSKKRTRFAHWDPIDFLKSEGAIAAYLAAAMEEAPDDSAFIATVLGDIARARRMLALINAPITTQVETPAEINSRNRKFWDEQSSEFSKALRKRPSDARVAARIMERRLASLNAALGPDSGTKAISALESLEQIVADLDASHAASSHQKAATAGRESGKSRRGRNQQRNERVRRAHAAGRTPKQIAGDEGISVSQINRILDRSRARNQKRA